MATNRTPTGTSAKAKRCAATEGAQQCLREAHPKIGNHTWGPKGETAQWTADGTPQAQPDDVTDQLVRVDEDPPPGPGTDQFGTVDGVYHPAPDPVPGTSHKDFFNGEAERRAIEHRAAVAATVTEQDRAEMEHIGATHPDIIRPNGASGAPGESIADVLANDVQNTISFGETDPTLAKERVWRELATTTVLRIATYNAPPPNGPGTVAPAEVLLALRDQVEHLIGNRGLGNGGGS